MDCASLNDLFIKHFNYKLGISIDGNLLTKDNAPIFPFIETKIKVD